MADRLKMLRAVARQVAAERADAPAPRPPSARIPLPRDHELDLAMGRTHAVRLTGAGIDADRFAAALRVAASRHDALRLGVVRDSGRSFLAELPDPVAPGVSLDQADPSHPLRWSVSGDTITVAVSTYLMDRSCWGLLLGSIQAAYDGEPDPARSVGTDDVLQGMHGPDNRRLDYGDYCYWLAHRDEPESIDLGHPEPEPYWAFTAGQPWSVECRTVPDVAGSRADAFDELTSRIAGAFFGCGWQTAGIRVQQWKPRLPETPIVGRVDQPVVGVVRRGGGVMPFAPTGAVADAVDPWWASFNEPLVQVDVDVMDLPQLEFDGKPVQVEPVLQPSSGWHCLLVRQPTATHLYLTGPNLTLPPLHTTFTTAAPSAEALPRPMTGQQPDCSCSLNGRTGASDRQMTGQRSVEAPPRPMTGQGPGCSCSLRGRTSASDGGVGTVTAPGIVTSVRTLAVEVVEGASERRAKELQEAGLQPGSPLVIEATESPETIANLVAGLKCRADVLLLDPDDPAEWSSGLLTQLPGAVRVSSDNAVHPATAEPTGDGEGALLVGLSSAPGSPVLARVPLDSLLEGAAAAGEMWKGRACVVNAARGGEDLVLKVLACGTHGADIVLVGRDGPEAVELLTQIPDSCVEQHLAADWSAPLHQLTDLTWTRRGTECASGVVTRWWVGEAPAAQWLATDHGLRLRSGAARLVDDGGQSMPEATIGRLAVAVPNGSRYQNDPRRTAEHFRPCSDGGRELWTDTIAANRGSGMQPLRFARDRTVDRNRTCLTDAWHAVASDAFVGVEPAAERVFVVSPRPVDTTALPRPLAEALVRVDPAATDLDLVQAWRSVQTRVEHDGEPEDWASEDEAALAKEVVEPVLGMPVRRNDDLFSLGATSLQLMRVLLQVKERYGVEVPLARFFAAPTVRVLSELMQQTNDPAAAALEVLQGIEGEDP